MSGLNFYPQYKDSGVEWIGEIPISWSVRPLFSIAQENRRSNKGMIEDNLLSLSYGNVISKDITTNEGLLPQTFETYQIVEPDDVVFRLTDLQNDKRSLRSALVSERGIITSAYLSVKPMNIEPRYFAYAMRDADLRKVFYSMGGGLRQSMKYDDMKWLQVTYPSTSEQFAISNYLDDETGKIDDFIAEQEELISLLDERRIATIAEAVTKGVNPDAPMKNSKVAWMGDVPSHWTVQQIKWITPVKRGASPRPIDDAKYFDENGTWSWVRIADVSASDGYLHETTQTLSTLGSTLSVKLEPDSLFVSIAGTVGKPCITKIPACIHDGFVYFPNLPAHLRKFLYRIFEAGQCYAGLGKFGTQLNLNTDTIGSIKIAVPPISEVAVILDTLGEELKQIDAAIADAREAIALSRERRAALISAAVTGKIDVRNWRGSTERVLESHGVA